MSWSTPRDLRDQLERLWTKGRILSDMAGEGGLFPLALRLVGPDSQEWSTRFDEARRWARSLDAIEHALVVTERRRHPTLGENEFPVRVVVESREQALAWIERLEDAERFHAQLGEIRGRFPELEPWVVRNPLTALEHHAQWARLLDVVDWFRDNPRSGIFPRELDLPGIDTKFVEGHRSLLSSWFDLVLEAKGEEAGAAGPTSFESRYGFREKQRRVRFRILDPEAAFDAFGCATDLEIEADAFARWDPPSIHTVFVLENEITFLAFPNHPGSIAVFGSGYGFEGLGRARWLGSRDLFYWGDLDTHGFAILDQFRAHFPGAQSLLMDRTTLLSHRERWSSEPVRSVRDLPRLTDLERELYRELAEGVYGNAVRLEQERIQFGRLLDALGRNRGVRAPQGRC